MLLYTNIIPYTEAVSKRVNSIYENSLISEVQVKNNKIGLEILNINTAQTAFYQIGDIRQISLFTDEDVRDETEKIVVRYNKIIDIGENSLKQHENVLKYAV